MRVYLRDWSTQTILRAATLRYKLQIKLSISSSHSILTLGHPVPALTLLIPGAWQGSQSSVNFSSHWYDLIPEKSQCKQDSNPGSSALKADALTTRPMLQELYKNDTNKFDLLLNL